MRVLAHDTVIISTATYAEAQETVRTLRASGMERDSLAVVGAGLVLAERPGGPSTAALTARSSTAGLGIGLLAAVFVTLVADTSLTGLVVVLWGAVYGVIVGALAGLFRGLFRNRPDAEATEIVPVRYEVRCAAADASVARRLIGIDQPTPTRKAA
ncbi:hypothetical protein GCM10009554_01790 [Kribbella koreensis]|uniref:General stress protein 17M-like domain-containing protein n=1 Tax=Kribbella koreensis TaxID=57909 RepID=A0ABP3ZKE1_9ACTN